MIETNEFKQMLGMLVTNWQPCIFPTHAIMEGTFCRIEPLNLTTHLNDLYAALCLQTSDASWTFLPYGPFKAEVDFTKWLMRTYQEKDTLLYALYDKKFAKPLGLCGYLRITPEHGVIEVGHLHYADQLKRSPATSEAMYLMMKNAFENLHYRRYEWKCNSLNQASKNAAERLGFKFEGIFRQHCVFKNRNRDTAWFSILDSEWPLLKQKFERWLSPSNFDAKGQQRVKLTEI